MPTKRETLELAIKAVGDRGLNYGKPEDNFNRIARRWTVHMANRYGVDFPLDAIDVAIMMSDVKTARLEHQPQHLDSWVDLAGYAACGAEIAFSTADKAADEAISEIETKARSLRVEPGPLDPGDPAPTFLTATR